MESSKFLIRNEHGKKYSVLDKEYNRHMLLISSTINSDEEELRWDTYSLIMNELKKESKTDFTTEIKYRITDGENPNEIFLDIINRHGDEVSNLMWFMKKRLEYYLEEDYFKKFY